MRPLLSTAIPEMCVEVLGGVTLMFLCAPVVGMNSPISPENPSLYQMFPAAREVIRGGLFSGAMACSLIATFPPVVGVKLAIFIALFSTNGIVPELSLVMPYGYLSRRGTVD